MNKTETIFPNGKEEKTNGMNARILNLWRKNLVIATTLGGVTDEERDRIWNTIEARDIPTLASGQSIYIRDEQTNRLFEVYAGDA